MIRSRPHRRRLSVALAGLLALALMLPALAAAHATLESSSPAQGAVVERPPDAVTFTFDEPVEGSFGAVRVFSAVGERVDEGDAFHPGGEGRAIAVHLRDGLADGSYTATYRVVSADGHVVSGGFVFSIGAPGRAPGETVSELIAGQGASTATKAGLGVSRGLQYLGIALVAGLVAFGAIVWLPAAGAWAGSAQFARRHRLLLLAGAVAGALGSAAGIVFEAADAAGISPADALSTSILGEELGTRFGEVWALAAGAFAVAALLAAFVPPPLRAWPYFAPIGAFLVCVPALSGHPSTQSPTALLLPANVLHVAAMAAWLGGLAALVFAVPAATRVLEPADRTRVLAGILPRFSALALTCVGLILLSGLVQSYAYVRDPADLLATGYGRAVSVKFLLLLALIALGAHNRRRSVPEIERRAGAGESPGGAGLALRRAIRTEVALLVGAIATTAVLAGYAPPVTAQSGPFNGGTRVGPAQLDITVDPARVGANQVHLYLFDARTGDQFTSAKQVTLTAVETDRGIGPLRFAPQRSGPGHYTVPNAAFGVAGTWELDVAVRTSRFDEYDGSLEVEIR